MLEDCVLGPQVMVGRNSRLRNSIILEKTVIGRQVNINGAIIAEGCLVEDEAAVTGEAKLWPGVKIAKNSRVLTDIKV